MQRAWMRRASPAIALCATLAFVAGCGSSSSTNSNSASSATTKTASGGIKYDTTPKYAAPSSSAPVQSGVVPVAYRNIAINPDTIRVKVGSTIKWTNYDPVEHNVTSESGPLHFASKDFGEGKTVEFKMTKPGIIHYECTIHPATMNGTIEVVK
jgi:plastocyanin